MFQDILIASNCYIYKYNFFFLSVVFEHVSSVPSSPACSFLPQCVVLSNGNNKLCDVLSRLHGSVIRSVYRLIPFELCASWTGDFS